MFCLRGLSFRTFFPFLTDLRTKTGRSWTRRSVPDLDLKILRVPGPGPAKNVGPGPKKLKILNRSVDPSHE